MGVGSGGDYAQEKRWHTDKSADFDYAGSALANAITPKSSLHSLFIQKITISITTHADATVTFDDDGSGNPIAAITDEATVVPTVPSSWTWDFGPKGVQITQGANLDISAGTGMVAKIHIEAYEKLTGTTRSWLDGASVQ